MERNGAGDAASMLQCGGALLVIEAIAATDIALGAQASKVVLTRLSTLGPGDHVIHVELALWISCWMITAEDTFEAIPVQDPKPEPQRDVPGFINVACRPLRQHVIIWMERGSEIRQRRRWHRVSVNHFHKRG